MKGVFQVNQYRDFDNYLKEQPSENGYFGRYGGNYLEDPELIKAFNEYAEAYNTIAQSAQFIAELRRIRRDFQGRPTPVYHCQNLSNLLGRTQIYLKREDLNHTGAHKLNHCMGEGLLAKYMGKKKLIAETGAGQHGVALATAAAYFGMACDIYMGEVDIAKQAPNVTRMKLLGANVIPVSFGLKTLKEAVDAAFMAYAREYRDAVYCIGTAAGPHPFPRLVAELQSVVGKEARAQILEQTGKLPDAVVACVGGGSNAIGIFRGFMDDSEVRLLGVEAAGTGEPGCFNSAALNLGTPGVLHGNRTLLLQTPEGQIEPSHSVAAGLDYPGVGPEHAWLKDTGRAWYGMVRDGRALAAFERLSQSEGILPALESSHALAWVFDHPQELPQDGCVVVSLSGRGDKDMDIVRRHLGEKYSIPGQAED